MFELLQSLDESLFLLINKTWANPFFDALFPFLTNLFKTPYVLYGVFPALLFWGLYRARKPTFRLLAAAVVVAGVTDAVCYWGIKSVIERPRPNHIEALQGELRVNYGPKSPSFPSNHAATTVALMGLLWWFFPAYKWVFIFYAALMGYSRVYVGVHFPLDVFGGALIGAWIFLGLKQFLFERFYWFRPERLIR